MNLRIYPYQMASESARDLAELLDVKRIRQDSDTFRPARGMAVVNWGNGRVPIWNTLAQSRQVRTLNAPAAVNTASNKLTALEALRRSGIRTPEFTTDQNVARRWLSDGSAVVERHELRGNSGEGIRIVNNLDDEFAGAIERAPLYTKFIPKTAEFRVHVFRGEVIDYIEKKRVMAERRPANFNKYISSINLGWVFSRTDVRDLPEVRQIAIRSVSALGLDFGAVDIVFYDGLPYVLEVNTAPGLAGTTLVKYANAIRKYMGASDLPAHVTNNLLDREQGTPVQSARPVAAHVAQDDSGYVTLRIDRATARHLRSLLSQVF